MPQLAENYRSKSADGISLAFLLVWFVGDITNLAGAIWAGLVPTVVALGLYFCLADAVLISQCLYYKRLHSRKEKSGRASAPGSDSDLQRPLLNGEDLAAEPGLSRRSRRTSSFRDGSLPVPLVNSEPASSWVWNAVSPMLVCILGATAWAIAWKARLWTPTTVHDDQDIKHGPVGAIALGYLSAACYLG